MPKNIEPDATKSHGKGMDNGIRTDYGKDNSFTVFGKDKERGQSGFKGGMQDLSRSISSGSAPKDSRKDVG